MKYSYYPGCTLRTKARDLDEYARASATALGFELEEIEDWQCCGGVYPLGTDEIATKLSSVRALNQAKEKGQDLVTICSACHHVDPFRLSAQVHLPPEFGEYELRHRDSGRP